MTKIFIITALFLRLLVANFISLKYQTIPSEIVFIYEFISFALITLLHYFEKDNLIVHNIDRTFIYVFIFSALVLSIGTLGVDSPLFFLSFISYFIISLNLIVNMIKRRFRYGKTRLLWILLGIVIGSIIPFIMNLPSIVAGDIKFTNLPVSNVIIVFLNSFSGGALIEEAIFRGFLWGVLRKENMMDLKIWLLQALLFWTAHFRFIDDYFMFWIVTPLIGLVLGWIVWRSRSITASLFAHATFNAIWFYL